MRVQPSLIELDEKSIISRDVKPNLIGRLGHKETIEGHTP